MALRAPVVSFSSRPHLMFFFAGTTSSDVAASRGREGGSGTENASRTPEEERQTNLLEAAGALCSWQRRRMTAAAHDGTTSKERTWKRDVKPIISFWSTYELCQTRRGGKQAWKSSTLANPSVATGAGLRLEEEGHPLVAVIQIVFLFLLRLEGLRLGALLCAYARVTEKAVRRRRNRIRVPS